MFDKPVSEHMGSMEEQCFPYTLYLMYVFSIILLYIGRNLQLLYGRVFKNYFLFMDKTFFISER